MQKSQSTKSAKPSATANANKQRLRQIFEESFKQFGPFERNEGIGKPYKDDVQSTLYISFSNALNRIHQLETDPKPQKTEDKGEYIVMREDPKKGYIAHNGLKPVQHYAKACMDALQIANTTGVRTIVFSGIRGYEPRKEPVKKAPVQKMPTVNPMATINRLYGYFDTVSPEDRPDHSPQQLLNTDKTNVVILKNGEQMAFDTPVKAFEYVDNFLNAVAKNAAAKELGVGRGLVKPIIYDLAPAAPQTAEACQAAAL